MTVVIPDDVETHQTRFAFHVDLVKRVHLVAVNCPFCSPGPPRPRLPDDVSSPPDLCHEVTLRWTDHDSADLVRVALSPVLPNRLESGLADLHPCRRPYRPVDTERPPESGKPVTTTPSPT